MFSCSVCSGGYKVSNIGNSNDSRNIDGALQFNNVNKSIAGEYNLTIYYINGDDQGTERGLYISINGQVATSYDLAADGNWNDIQLFSVTVSLNANNNTIQFFNPNNMAPDIDRIVV